MITDGTHCISARQPIAARPTISEAAFGPPKAGGRAPAAVTAERRSHGLSHSPGLRLGAVPTAPAIAASAHAELGSCWCRDAAE